MNKAAVLGVLAAWALLQEGTPENAIPLKQVQVTLGSVKETPSGFLTVVGPKERAQLRKGNHSHAKLQFRYREPSAKTSRLGSGEVVRQIGLKLRAKNTCNLLYVMWRIEPEEAILISVKRNPGASTHEECENRGYQSIATVPLDPKVSASDHKAHVLDAVLRPDGRDFRLTVTVDGAETWNGKIDGALLAGIDGPAGFRTDNGSFIFKFYAE